MNQQLMGLPIVTCGNFTFNISAIAGIDWQLYLPGSEERAIDLHLLGGSVYTFTAETADAFKLWFDQVTGKARIQPAGLQLT